MLRWLLSHIRLSATPQAVAHQAPLSMGFSRQKYWSGLLFPTPGDLPKSGIKPIFLVSPALAVDSLPLCHLGRPLWEYAAAAKSLQSCPTLCDPVDCSLPGFSVHGIFQAKILEWVAISFSRGSSQPGFDPGLNPPCRQMLYCLSYQGSVKVLLNFFNTQRIVTTYGDGC